jgi:hypothetical protein
MIYVRELAMSHLKRCCLACSPRMRSTKIIVAVVLITLVLVFAVPFATAESNKPSVDWNQTYDGLLSPSVIQTSDGGYVIVGRALSSDVSTFIKTDSSGNMQWQKALGDIVSVVQTDDLGYAVFFNNQMLKMNADGDFEASFSLVDGVKQGIITSDGDYVAIGNSVTENGLAFAWLYKLDRTGNLLWNKTYTSGFTVYSVVETDDHGCALAGSLNNDFWLAKLDVNGNQQWSQNFAYGGLSDVHIAYSMVQTNDGGYMLAGVGEWQLSSGHVPWLVKVNSQGHDQWRVIGNYTNDSFNAVVQTDDTGYVLALGGRAVLVRTDSSGSELWTLTLSSESDWRANYLSSCLIRTNDGGYATAGTLFGNSTFVAKVSSEPDFQPPRVSISSPGSQTYVTSDVPLVFTVNKPTSWIAYSLDGQSEVIIAGNTTLSGLAIGTHTILVSAQDIGGVVGTSETVQFTIAEPFPTALVAIGIAIAIIVVGGFLAYVKRSSLSAYKKKGLTSFFQKPSFSTLKHNRLLWTLTIIGLSILLVFTQIFFPYVYYSIASGNNNSNFEVGISYVYEQDNIGQIYNEVSHIKDLGFDVIRVNLICDPLDPTAYSNTITNVFYSAVSQIGINVALIINNHDSDNNINYYLNKWGNYLTYVQVLNEPDVATSWDLGALFTDDEAGSRFDEIYGIVQQHHLSAQSYTNFGPAFLLRTNLPVKFSEKLDFVGLDIFMDSFLTISPRMIQFLQKITNKQIVISEFGMSTSDDTTQADYIMKGLNLFKSMGLKGCWIVYWNSVDNVYGIRGRLAEQKVGEWIAQNA